MESSLHSDSSDALQAAGVHCGLEKFGDPGIPHLTPGEFNFFSDKIQELSGIRIEREKIGMLTGRLNRRLRALELSNYSCYVRHLKQDANGKETALFINSLTTNKTSFFREEYHFDYLRDMVLERARTKTLYLWSAACSTGEEPYSLAIQCEELRGDLPAFDYRLLATDIDTECLRDSAEGLYDRDDLADMPAQMQQKYFKILDDSRVSVVPKLKRRLKFRQHNLIDYGSVLPVKFDVIFIRNVLFYFPKPTITKVIRKLAKQLVPGGLLFVSLTESLASIDTGLTSVGSSVYQKASH